MPIQYYIYLCLALFSIGIIGVLTRRNAIIVFMCVELMLNAVNLLLVAFSKMHYGQAIGANPEPGCSPRPHTSTGQTGPPCHGLFNRLLPHVDADVGGFHRAQRQILPARPSCGSVPKTCVCGRPLDQAVWLL